MVFGNLEEQIDSRRREIEELDLIDDALGLEEEEIMRRNQFTAELLRYSIWRDKLLSQKAKIKGMTEGDVNSKFFHNWINRKSKCSRMEGIWVDNSWVDSVSEVKESGARHFRRQFSARNISQPHLPSNIFRK